MSSSNLSPELMLLLLLLELLSSLLAALRFLPSNVWYDDTGVKITVIQGGIQLGTLSPNRPTASRSLRPVQRRAQRLSHPKCLEINNTQL
jgi:hypothetical protein